jgi:hypothetical protein
MSLRLISLSYLQSDGSYEIDLCYKKFELQFTHRTVI